MSFDLVIENVTLYDGTGRPGFSAHVGIKDGKICKVSKNGHIGQIKGENTEKTIDGSGKILCPGFVDIHSHADTFLHFDTQEELLEPLLRQGITTFVGGNCGMGLAPHTKKFKDPFLMYIDMYLGEDQEPYVKWDSMAGFMEVLETKGVAINTAILAPHAILRIAAKGLSRSPATRDEMKLMKSMLEECLEAGAVGMSTGLQYFPGLAADEEELVELAEILATRDATFTSHLRSYSDTLPLAIEELMNISRRAGVRAQISHLFWLPHVNLPVDRAVNAILRVGAKIYKHVKLNLPLDLAMREKLQTVGDEIEKGLPIGIDAMPTGAGFTHALAFFPPWSLEGTRDDVINRFTDRETRKKVYKSIVKGKSTWPHREEASWSMNFFQLMGFKSIHLMSVVSEKNRKYVGKNFVQIGRERGTTPFDAVCDLLLEENGRVLVFETPTWPGDEFVERSLYATIADPNVSIASDTLLIANGKPSHLYYDCFPKLMGKYVRDEKILSLAEAIRKSTSLPAAQLGLKGRGEIKEGNWADLVIFDEATIGSRSTPFEPAHTPTGIEYVLVNGKIVVSPDGYSPSPRPGHLIRHGQK